MTSDLLTVKEIAKRLSLPESSIRYYRDRFSAWIPVVGEGRNRRYPISALDVLRTIAELSRLKTPSDMIERNLTSQFPLIIKPQQDADSD